MSDRLREHLDWVIDLLTEIRIGDHNREVDRLVFNATEILHTAKDRINNEEEA